MAVRGVRGRQRHRRQLPRRHPEVGGRQLDRIAAGGDRRQTQTALAVRARDHRRRPAVLALVDVHHVARAQLQHRQLDRIVASARLACLFDRLPVLGDVAERALRLLAQPGQPGPLAFEPGLDAHHVAIGLELRERQVEQVVRLLVAVVAHQVGGHVVRRPERGTQMERTAAGELGDRFEAHERAPRHHRVPQFVDTPAARPPGELRVLAGRELLVVVAGELRELLDHDGPSRHVDPDRERLGGEHHLHEALDEAGFDDLLERRHHAGVVGSEPGLELGRGTVRSRAPRDRPGRASRGGRRRSAGCGRARPRR